MTKGGWAVLILAVAVALSLTWDNVAKAADKPAAGSTVKDGGITPPKKINKPNPDNANKGKGPGDARESDTIHYKDGEDGVNRTRPGNGDKGKDMTPPKKINKPNPDNASKGKGPDKGNDKASGNPRDKNPTTTKDIKPPNKINKPNPDNANKGKAPGDARESNTVHYKDGEDGVNRTRPGNGNDNKDKATSPPKKNDKPNPNNANKGKGPYKPND